MQSARKICLLALLICAVFSPSATAAAAAAPATAAPATTTTAHAAATAAPAGEFSLQSLASSLSRGDFCADFSQQKHIAGFSQPLASSGRVCLQGSELIYELQAPISSRLKLSEQGEFLYQNGAWRKQKSSYAKEFFLALLRLDLPALSKNFKISLSGSEAAWQLDLAPKNLLRKAISSIEISGSRQIERVKVREANGDSTESFYAPISAGENAGENAGK